MSAPSAPPAQKYPAEYEKLLFPKPGRKPAELLKRASNISLDLLYPPHCVACGSALSSESNGAFCAPCLHKVFWIGHERCTRCGERAGQGLGVISECPACRDHPPAFVKASCAVAQYEQGTFRDAILALKFGNAVFAANLMGRLLAERITQTQLIDKKIPAPLIVPIPLYKSDRKSRGYNQTEELAQVLAGALGLKVESKLLRKIQATRPQAKLSRTERLENLKGAFAVDPKRAKALAGKSILLVDDVMTTGATASESGRTLHAAGFNEIRMAMLARG